jgi:long-chain acyl-CoA synthetase
LTLLQAAYILNHTEAKFILVETLDHWSKVKKEWDAEGLPHLQKAILMEGVESDDERLLTWEAFLALGEGIEDQKIDEAVASLDPEGLGTLIYTSGTTGPPKGVMLSHKNMTWTAKAAEEICRFTSDDSSLSFLPLSHIAEQMVWLTLLPLPLPI